MMTVGLSFEEADAAVAREMHSSVAGGALPAAAPPPSAPGVPPQICSVYGIIKPILQLIGTLVPANWKKAIQEFIAAMDRLCSPGAPAGTAAGIASISFEDADKAVKQALVQHLTMTASVAAASTPATIATQVCGVYKAIRPILQFASTFVPGAWKAGIVVFMSVFDGICQVA